MLPLCTQSAPSKRWANHLSYPFVPTPGHTPTLTPYKEPAHSALGSKRGNQLLFSIPLLQQGPQKSLAGISYLASDQFLSVGEDQELWLVPAFHCSLPKFTSFALYFQLLSCSILLPNNLKSSSPSRENHGEETQEQGPCMFVFIGH